MRWTFASISAGVIGLALVGSAPALSADLRPILKAPPRVAPIDYWTGLYVGANLGGAWSTADIDPNVGVPFPGFTSSLAAIPFTIEPPQLGSFPATSGVGSSALGGGQVGYNWQQDHWVLGVEADIDGTGLKAKSASSVTRGPPLTLIGPQTVTANYSAESDWIATLRARLGYTVDDRFMVYATAGVATANVRVNTAYAVALAAGLLPQGTPLTASDSGQMTGWTAGVGGEWAYSRDLSFGAEYRHIDLGGRTVNTGWVDTFVQAFFPPNSSAVHYTIDQVTARVNWHPWH